MQKYTSYLRTLLLSIGTTLLIVGSLVVALDYPRNGWNGIAPEGSYFSRFSALLEADINRGDPTDGTVKNARNLG
jgi:hypothetical protein